jgi:hypothetical protein
LAVSGLLLPTGLTACSTSPKRVGAIAVARSFVAAVSKHDGGAACDLLTDDARDAVTGATDASCADAVVNVKEQGSDVGRVAVWGDSAQVHIGSDVVFLLRERDGWQVSAAGCTPQTDAPYKCDVDG